MSQRMCLIRCCSIPTLLALLVCSSTLEVSAQHTFYKTAAAAVGSRSAHELPGKLEPSAEALVQLLTELGAEVNVAVRSLPEVGRALLAPRDIQKGDVLVRLPLELTYVADDSQGTAVAARQLLVNMAQQDHPLSLYFRALPDPSDVKCAVNMPAAYLSVLQDTHVEFSVRLLKAEAEEEWHRHSVDFWRSLGPAMSVSNITHAMALGWTRSFALAGRRLVPLLDFASHRPGCKHTMLDIEPCNATPALKHWAQRMPAAAVTQARPTPRQGVTSKPGCAQSRTARGSEDAPGANYCIVWRAGEAVGIGEEVCYTYSPVMLQDLALLRYGFLQEGPIRNELSMMDRPERLPGLFGIWQPMQALRDIGNGLPAKFTGTREELQTELLRLTNRLAKLSAGESRVAAVRVDRAADPQGNLLSTMLEWRRQRLNALAAEVRRLRSRLERMVPFSTLGLRGTAVS